MSQNTLGAILENPIVKTILKKHITIKQKEWMERCFEEHKVYLTGRKWKTKSEGKTDLKTVSENMGSGMEALVKISENIFSIDNPKTYEEYDKIAGKLFTLMEDRESDIKLFSKRYGTSKDALLNLLSTEKNFLKLEKTDFNSTIQASLQFNQTARNNIQNLDELLSIIKKEKKLKDKDFNKWVSINIHSDETFDDVIDKLTFISTERQRKEKEAEHRRLQTLMHEKQKQLKRQMEADNLKMQEAVSKFISKLAQNHNWVELDDNLAVLILKEANLPNSKQNILKVLEQIKNAINNQLIYYKKDLFEMAETNLIGCPYRTEKGLPVQSIGEKMIANFLDNHYIGYDYDEQITKHGIEKNKYGYNNSWARPDFYLTEFGIIIEYWGLKGDQDYDKKGEDKRRLYKESSTKYISIYPQDLQNLDNILTKKLQMQGLTI